MISLPNYPEDIQWNSMKSCKTKAKSIYGQCRMRCHSFDTSSLSLVDNTRKFTTRTKEFASAPRLFLINATFPRLYFFVTVNYPGKTDTTIRDSLSPRNLLCANPKVRQFASWALIIQRKCRMLGKSGIQDVPRRVDDILSPQ